MAENQEGIDPKEMLMQLQYLQNIYSQQYEIVQQNLNNFTIALGATARNIELLEKLSVVKNSDVLLNADGGMYLSAHVSDTKKPILYIGAGYMIEKNIEEAGEFLKANGKKNQDVMNRLISDKQKLESEILDISYKINVLQQQMPGQ